MDLGSSVGRTRKTPTEQRLYALQTLPRHLSGAGQMKQLRRLLATFDFLQGKTDLLGPELLISDYDLVREDTALRLVQHAIRLSVHILAADPTQLGGQLIGRLKQSKMPEVQALLGKATSQRCRAWLRPLAQSLATPGGSLLRTFSCHNRDINALVVMTDGVTAITASSDATIKVWDLNSGEQLRILKGHKASVNGLAVLPDSRHIVSASSDMTIKVWDVQSGWAIQTLTGHKDCINAVAVTPDGARVVSASDDHTLKIWALNSGSEICTLSGHGDWVTAVVVLPAGRWAVSGAQNGELVVWDLQNGLQLRTLQGHEDGINAVRVLPDGRRVVSASTDCTLKVWDVDSGTECTPHMDCSWFVNALDILPGGGHAVSASQDGVLAVWNLESGVRVRHITTHGGLFSALAALPDGHHILSGSEDGKVRLWDVECSEGSTAPLDEDLQAFRDVTGMVILSRTQQALTAAWNGTLTIWDLRNGQELSRLRGHTQKVNSVAVTPDQRLAISCSSDETLRVWDLRTGGESSKLMSSDTDFQAVTVTPDSKHLIAASHKFLKVWDLDSKVELRSLPLNGYTVALALFPDEENTLVATATGIAIWDLLAGRELGHLTTYIEEVTALAVAPSSNRVIYSTGLPSSLDYLVKIWDLERRIELNVLKIHDARIAAVDITADGKLGVSASEDATLKLWDVESGSIITSFGFDDPLSACAIAPDGQIIVVGEDSGRVHFLRLEGPE